MSADPAAVYERLKLETAQMLGLNTDSSSLLENLQVDLVSLLRLQIDDLQGKVLNGQQVDLARLSAALTMLRQLLPEKALVAPAAAADHVDQFAGAREELARLFDQRANALERRMAMFPQRARDEFEAKLQAAIEKYPDVSNPLHACSTDALKTVCSDAQSDDGVAHPPPALDAPADGGEHPVLVEPPDLRATVGQSPPPPPRRSLDDINSTPANPPAPPVEEWRRWVDSDGIRTSPWSGGR
jgi:hypothetical protein